ncbi:peptidoglycan-binding domain-containing protein [Brasilonema sp. UFV-L1]|uniref:peptidoglycan-binding domain-containing protein n=1 Tax=Brasilonema sp. UFV-L1 TaxID=2234130 RepID=UPI00145E0721|nr:peptidoglycan-binding domain-containing protein [Brasilonema sp. UFV-L1]NMG09758.1 hypothetical protein [Brasilonema sp. UFV-L1]
MKTLADPQVAVRHEDLNPLSKLSALRDIKLKAPKAVKFIAIAVGCITAGVVASTAAQAETVHKTLSYGDRGSGVATLQSKLGGIAVDGIFGSQTLSKLKSYQAAHGLAVDGVATSKTLASIGSLNLAQASNQTPLQQGKLKLINDIPRPMIIYLKKPGDVRHSRYAYLRGCTERTLNAQYSSSWNVSNDFESWQGLNVHRGGVYEVRASSMEKRNDGVKCLGFSQLKEEVRTEWGANTPPRVRLIATRYDTPLKVFGFVVTVLADVGAHASKFDVEQIVLKFRQASQNSRRYTSLGYKKFVEIWDSKLALGLDEATRVRQTYIEFLDYIRQERAKGLRNYLQQYGDEKNFAKIDNFISTYFNTAITESTPPRDLREKLLNFFTEVCAYNPIEALSFVNSLVQSYEAAAIITKEIPAMSTPQTVVASNSIIKPGDGYPLAPLDTLSKADCIRRYPIPSMETVVSLAPGQK